MAKTRKYIDEMPRVTATEINAFLKRYKQKGYRETTLNFMSSGNGRVRLEIEREGLLKWTLFESWTDESEQQSGTMTYIERPCNFGGTRVYLVCPATEETCLALFFNGGAWVSRQAGDLHYRTQSEREIRRLTKKAENIKAKMRGNGESWLIKPKGMPQKRYSELWQMLNKTYDKQAAIRTKLILQLGSKDLLKEVNFNDMDEYAREHTVFESQLEEFGISSR